MGNAVDVVEDDVGQDSESGRKGKPLKASRPSPPDQQPHEEYVAQKGASNYYVSHGPQPH